MEIIKKGTPPPEPNPIHEGTCGRCGTIVRFHENEAVSIRVCGTLGSYPEVHCPVCPKRRSFISGQRMKATEPGM
jgi:hypothetical protein